MQLRQDQQNNLTYPLKDWHQPSKWDAIKSQLLKPNSPYPQLIFDLVPTSTIECCRKAEALIMLDQHEEAFELLKDQKLSLAKALKAQLHFIFKNYEVTKRLASRIFGFSEASCNALQALMWHEWEHGNLQTAKTHLQEALVIADALEMPFKRGILQGDLQQLKSELGEAFTLVETQHAKQKSNQILWQYRQGLGAKDLSQIQLLEISGNMLTLAKLTLLKRDLAPFELQELKSIKTHLPEIKIYQICFLLDAFGRLPWTRSYLDAKSLLGQFSKALKLELHLIDVLTTATRCYPMGVHLLADYFEILEPYLIPIPTVRNGKYKGLYYEGRKLKGMPKKALPVLTRDRAFDQLQDWNKRRAKKVLTKANLSMEQIVSDEAVKNATKALRNVINLA